MRGTDDLPVLTANCHLHHGSRDRKDEYEDMKNVYAYNTTVCDGDYCPMDCDVCGKKDDAEEANESVAEDIQHVGYTPEACGYEK